MDTETLEVIRLFFYLLSAVVAFYLAARLIKGIMNNPGIVAFLSVLVAMICAVGLGTNEPPVQPVYFLTALLVSIVFLIGATIQAAIRRSSEAN